MPSEPYFLAPNLSILLVWSSKLADALLKGCHFDFFDSLEESPQRSQEYERWDRAKLAAYAQIRRLYTVTGNLPQLGDVLSHSTRIGEFPLPELRIDKCTIFTVDDSDELQLVYHLGATEEEMPEYMENEENEARLGA